MKKIMTAIAATIIASTCMFFACSKEENETVKNEKCLEFTETDPGILHNELLKMEMLTPRYFNRSEYESLELAYDFCQKQNLFIDLPFDIFVKSIDTLKTIDDFSLIELARQIANENNFCDKYLFFAERLNDLETLDHDIYLEQLELLKNEIANDKELNSNEKNDLLGGISIAINSALFWTNEYPEIIKIIPTDKECSYPKDPKLSNCENMKVRWADVKGWFKNNKSTRSISAQSASRKKHQDIINEHGEGYSQDY